MDVSARAALKGAAKCDKHCELQNSVNRQEPERILFFWDIPESMPSSVSLYCSSRLQTIVTSAIFMPRGARARGLRLSARHLNDELYVLPPAC